VVPAECAQAVGHLVAGHSPARLRRGPAVAGRKLRVALNALHLVAGETGGGEIYARNLVAALAARGDAQLTLFLPREARGSEDEWPSTVDVEPLPVPGRNRALRVGGEQTVLPAALRRGQVDLLHNLFSTAPVVPGVPQVTTVYDLIYKRYPEAHRGVLSAGMAALVSVAARRSRRLLTLSQATKRDLVDFLHVEADLIDVTYAGPGMTGHAKPMPEDELRRSLGLDGAPLVLTVSAKRPHKNLRRLFAAFAQVQSDPPPVLVVPGYATPFERDLQEAADRAAPGRIRFAGWVDESTLEGLYRSATCFVFPSLAEGFGLPVLEALARGVPTASSNATSLPEVAGDAVLYFDPLDIASIADALERLLSDHRLRERLAEAGRAQARRFSWQETAELTRASYERALSASSRS
jgi:glycosyltransferase involved in cell wall biosynthesis